MTAHPQSALVSGFHNPANEFRLQRTVELDLNVAKVSITIHRRDGLFECIRVQSSRSLKRPPPIDKPSLPNTRTHCRSLVPLVLQTPKVGDVIAHVANTGHPAGNVKNSVDRLHVGMHVEQTWHKSLSGAIDL